MNATVSPEEISHVVAPLEPILADDSVWRIMIDRHERVRRTPPARVAVPDG